MNRFALFVLGFYTVAAAASTDLTITKSVAFNPIVSAGQNVQFTLIAQNKGPDPVPSMSITDVIPAGSTFVGVDTAFSGGWSCSGTTTVTCTSPGSVPVSGGTLLYITMTAPSTPGPFTNRSEEHTTELQ